MAKPIAAVVKLQVPAGQATPAPPVGTALGPHGVNIMEFVKQFNARTQGQTGMVTPVEVTIYKDRSFTFITKTPPAAVLLKKEAGIEKGSPTSNRQKVGKVTRAQVRKIAEIKLPDLNATTLSTDLQASDQSIASASVTDARTGLIPDALNLPFIVLAFLRATLYWHVGFWPSPIFLSLVLQSAVLAGGFLGLQWLLSRGRWVGSGDVILAAGIGFFLPDPWLTGIALWCAYVSAALVAAILLARGKKKLQSTLVFGPFLAGGAVMSFFFGEYILMRLFGA